MKKLLVANRAEIACRIFQSCRELGYGTVGIYVDGDEDARHVTYADEIFHVTSYLDADGILEIAKRAGADLIHPGYGYLSENAQFVAKVEKAGLVFVGPRPDSMEVMGSKIQAKLLADKIGVPNLPWAQLKSQDIRPDELKEAANKVGYPLLLKAEAGGGGKGMRLVQKEGELLSGAEMAMSEAKSSFGNGTLFLERYLEGPRHIEVQVFGDGNGNGAHFFERECSIQRRHQKVWEEAPVPNLSEKTRRGLYDSSLKLVSQMKYRGAGTCEFLVNGDDYFFLEMNTRLQVEHPVTEFVTGVDLVRLQILQAVGERAEVQRPASPHGHAIEVRIYAEDPSKNYLPTPGKVEVLKWPTGPGIRVDSGIEEGQRVGTQFDPMLAKLVVSATSREHAIQRMRFALDETVIMGLGTNLPFLRKLCDEPAVKEAKVDTSFLQREYSTYKMIAREEELEIFSQMKSTGRSSGVISEKASHPSPWERVEL